MGIISLITDLPGQIGDNPRRPKLITTDNLATITTAGYLNPANLEGQSIFTTDVLDVYYGYVNGHTPGIYDSFTATISNSGVITLVLTVPSGSVLLPVVSGDFAIFNGTTGQIKDSSQAASNAANPFVVTSPGTLTTNHIAQIADANGSIKDGGVLGTAAAKAASDNTKATLASINAAPTSGHIAAFTDNVGTIGDGGALGTAAAKAASDNTKTTVASVSGSTVLNNLIKAADTAGTIADSGIPVANVAQTQSSVANNNIAFTIVKTLTFTQLATAGKVNIVTHPTGTSQFAVLDIKVLKSTGLSGGGGDRLLAVSDSTIVFNNAGITASLLGTPILTVWGGTGNPLAIGASEVSTAGADIFFQYTGGTTDYNAGSVQVAVTLVQVTT
jgi:hypothetical protein